MSASAPLLFAPPPNSSHRKKREWKKQMRLWLRDQLDEQHIQHVNDANSNAPTAERWLEIIAIAEARAGKPGRLRSLYPNFADCIFSPKLRHGQRYPKHKMKFDVAKMAADFARCIRTMWREQYRKVNRHRVCEFKPNRKDPHWGKHKLKRPIPGYYVIDEEKLAAALAAGDD